MISRITKSKLLFPGCLLAVFLFAASPFAESVMETPGSASAVTQDGHDSKNKSNILKSLGAWYRKAKEYAKTYTNTVNSVSELLYSSYCLLAKWEEISNETAWLLSTNPFEAKGFEKKVENLEQWMVVSDKVLFEDIPAANQLQDNVGKSSTKMVDAFRNAFIDISGEPQKRKELVRNQYLAHFKQTYTPMEANGKKRIVLTRGMERGQQAMIASAERNAEQAAMDEILAQHNASIVAIGQDVAEDLQTPITPTGLQERTDMEIREGLLASKNVQYANRQSIGTNEALIAQNLYQIDNYHRAAELTTAWIGGLMIYADVARKLYPAYKLQLAYVPSQWSPGPNGKYTNAYRYENKIYSLEIP